MKNKNIAQIIQELHNVPKYLNFHYVLKSKVDFEKFIFANQDLAPLQNEERVQKIREQFNDWVSLKDPNNRRVCVFYEDPDDFARNDNWGSKLLYRCIITKTNTGDIVVMGDVMEKF